MTFFSVKRFGLLAVAFCVLLFAALLSASFYVGTNKGRIVELGDVQPTRIGIVFGAGVDTNGQPQPALQARLDVAAQALADGIVQKLILSGDNRVENYDEPSAMQAYLVSRKGIDLQDLQPDYAGRSTYETCERAAKVFGVEQAVLFSANYHLPRALYLCGHFGIDSQGVANSVERRNPGRREHLARLKAVYNVYISGESTVLGEPIAI